MTRNLETLSRELLALHNTEPLCDQVRYLRSLVRPGQDALNYIKWCDDAQRLPSAGELHRLELTLARVRNARMMNGNTVRGSSTKRGGDTERAAAAEQGGKMPMRVREIVQGVLVW